MVRHISMIALGGVLLVLSLASTSEADDDMRFNRPVTSLDVRADGTYRAGFMYWFAPLLFQKPAEFVVLGRVSRVLHALIEEREAKGDRRTLGK